MKYIDIQTVSPDTYLVWACHDGMKTAVMLNNGKLTVNQKALGMKTNKNYKPPTGDLATFNRSEAISIAHQIGRYIFKLGDLVYAYTYVDGLRNDDFFVADLNQALGR
jgi:hypothetical protein